MRDLKKTLAITVAALMLVALAVGTIPWARPMHLASALLPVAAGALPTAAPLPALRPAVPRLRAGPSFAAARSVPIRAATGKNPVAARNDGDMLLPPSMLLVPRPDARPPGPNMAATPPPAAQQGPRSDMTAAAGPQGPRPGREMAATPPPQEPAGPNMAAAPPRRECTPSNMMFVQGGAAVWMRPGMPGMPQRPDAGGIWEELPSQREQPEIRVTNLSQLAGELILFQGTARRRWSWRGGGLVISDSVDPVDYTYEVRGPIYRSTGRPDVAGTLRCRKYHLYRVQLWARPGWDTQHVDLGD